MVDKHPTMSEGYSIPPQKNAQEGRFVFFLRRAAIVLGQGYVQLPVDILNWILAILGLGGPLVAGYGWCVAGRWGLGLFFFAAAPAAWLGVWYLSLATNIADPVYMGAAAKLF